MNYHPKIFGQWWQGGNTHSPTFIHARTNAHTMHGEHSGYGLYREKKTHGICLHLSNIVFGKKTCKNFRWLCLYCLPQHCKNSEKHKWAIVVSKPLIRLKIIESFKFASFTLTHNRIITHVERIIHSEITNSSLSILSVRLRPVKAVCHTWKFQCFRYLGLNNSTYIQKRAKTS